LAGVVYLFFVHRRAGGAAPLSGGKAIIFRANAKFFGQKPANKNEKILFLYLLTPHPKIEFIPPRNLSVCHIYYSISMELG